MGLQLSTRSEISTQTYLSSFLVVEPSRRNGTHYVYPHTLYNTKRDFIWIYNASWKDPPHPISSQFTGWNEVYDCTVSHGFSIFHARRGPHHPLLSAK